MWRGVHYTPGSDSSVRVDFARPHTAATLRADALVSPVGRISSSVSWERCSRERQGLDNMRQTTATAVLRRRIRGAPRSA